jgi:hypothetical protein
MWSSMLPGVISLARSACMSAGGLEAKRRSTARFATASRSAAPSGTTSSKMTGTPALASCPAMPAPMVPAPITAAFLISAMARLDAVYSWGSSNSIL